MFFRCRPASWNSVLNASILETARSLDCTVLSAAACTASSAGPRRRNRETPFRATAPRSAKSLRIFLHPSTTCPFSSRMRWRMASTFPSRALQFFCSKAFRERSCTSCIFWRISPSSSSAASSLRSMDATWPASSSSSLPPAGSFPISRTISAFTCSFSSASTSWAACSATGSAARSSISAIYESLLSAEGSPAILPTISGPVS